MTTRSGRGSSVELAAGNVSLAPEPTAKPDRLPPRSAPAVVSAEREMLRRRMQYRAMSTEERREKQRWAKLDWLAGLLEGIAAATAPSEDTSPRDIRGHHLGENAEGNETIPADEDRPIGKRSREATGNSSSPDTSPTIDTFEAEKPSCTDKWADCVDKAKAPFLRFLLFVTHRAAVHPKMCVVSILVFSAAIFIVGLLTNFETETSESLWTPVGSKAVEHAEWIEGESGFPRPSRDFMIIIHASGNNVLGREGVRRVFDAIDALRSTPGYDDLCELSDQGEEQEDGKITCPISAVTSFWNDTRSIFEDGVTSDEDAIRQMSATTYPDGTPVVRERILGNSQPLPSGEHSDMRKNLLAFAQSFLATIHLPPEEGAAEAFEKEALRGMVDLQGAWKAEGRGNTFQLEFFATRSFEDEFSRSIQADLPLIPAVFVVMIAFCCVFFAKCHKVKSQSILGFGAVVTVLLSIMAAYGVLFTCGVPFTFLTQILPFIMFGIGLDDAFIITGAFGRTDREKDASDRIADAIRDVGNSIFLTKLTTFVAFTLGCVSSIPAVRYLCLYAFPCVLFDFAYQITFFIALIVIDEKRMRDGRLDCIICVKVTEDRQTESDSLRDPEHIVERIMAHYSTFLLKPLVKVFVVIVFLSMLSLLAVSASNLEQAFDWTDIIPSDSYIQTFMQAYNDYTEDLAYWIGVYFRDPNKDGTIDFSDIQVQDQMHNYIDDLHGMKWISNPPNLFWLDYFEVFISASDVKNSTFEEQISAFMNDTVYNSLFASDIVLDGSGRMTASRTWMVMDQVDSGSISTQIEAFREQEQVTSEQPINSGLNTWPFFNYEGQYFIWGFYSVAVQELLISSLCAIAAVTLISFLFIPHWSAVLFVTPMVVAIYVELLGVVRLAGLHINSVTYIAMVMSIGLMVDYVMHLLIKFLEGSTSFTNRDETVCHVLKTMGASVSIAGLTTLLGVIPLAFSSSHIIYAVFVTFIGLVTLGMGHGLILLPVVLSLVGPMRRSMTLSKESTATTPEEHEDRAQQSQRPSQRGQSMPV